MEEIEPESAKSSKIEEDVLQTSQTLDTPTSLAEVGKGREVENVESRVEKVECVGRCQGLKWSHVALWQ